MTEERYKNYIDILNRLNAHAKVIDAQAEEIEELRILVGEYTNDVDVRISAINNNFNKLEDELTNVNKKVDDLSDSIVVIKEGIKQTKETGETTGVSVEKLLDKMFEMERRQDERDDARKDRTNKLLLAIIGTGILSPTVIVPLIEWLRSLF